MGCYMEWPRDLSQVQLTPERESHLDRAVDQGFIKITSTDDGCFKAVHQQIDSPVLTGGEEILERRWWRIDPFSGMLEHDIPGTLILDEDLVWVRKQVGWPLDFSTYSQNRSQIPHIPPEVLSRKPAPW